MQHILFSYFRGYTLNSVSFFPFLHILCQQQPNNTVLPSLPKILWLAHKSDVLKSRAVLYGPCVGSDLQLTTALHLSKNNVHRYKLRDCL